VDHWPEFQVPDGIDLGMSNRQQEGVKNILNEYLKEKKLTFRKFYPKIIVSYATGQRRNFDMLGSGPGMWYASLVIQSLFKKGYPCISGLMIPAGMNWEIFILRIAGSRSRAKVLVVLLTEAFFRSIPCLIEVYEVIKRRDVYIIPIRVDSGDYDISRDKEKMWPLDVIGDDDDLERKRVAVLDIVADLSTLPERGTLLSAREHTLTQLFCLVQEYV
jgi:hypothetical protein